MKRGFDACYERLLLLEGITLTDDPNDAGGATKYGISRLAYPHEDFANLTPERAKYLTKRDYWRIEYDVLVDGRIQYQLLESSFHFDPPGYPFRAVLIAQLTCQILGKDIRLDGIMGMKTVQALNSLPVSHAYKMMNVIQSAFLLVGKAGTDELLELVHDRLPQLKLYMKGWLRRIDYEEPVV